MAEAAFHKKKTLFTSKFKSDLRNKLVKCYIWTVALCGAGTWTFREVDKEYVNVEKFHGAGEGWRRSV